MLRRYLGHCKSCSQVKMTAMRDTDVSKSGAFVVKWRAKEKKERIGRVGMLLNVWMSSQLDATGGRCRVRSDRDRGCAVVLLTSTIDSRDAWPRSSAGREFLWRCWCPRLSGLCAIDQIKGLKTLDKKYSPSVQGPGLVENATVSI